MAQLSAVLLSLGLTVMLLSRFSFGSDQDFCLKPEVKKFHTKASGKPFQIISTETQGCLADGITCFRKGGEAAEKIGEEKVKSQGSGSYPGSETICRTSGACKAWPTALVDTIALSEPSVDEFQLKIDRTGNTTICFKETEKKAQSVQSKCRSAEAAIDAHSKELWKYLGSGFDRKASKNLMSMITRLFSSIKEICSVAKISQKNKVTVYTEKTKEIVNLIADSVQKQEKLAKCSSKSNKCESDKNKLKETIVQKQDKINNVSLKFEECNNDKNALNDSIVEKQGKIKNFTSKIEKCERDKEKLNEVAVQKQEQIDELSSKFENCKHDKDSGIGCTQLGFLNRSGAEEVFDDICKRLNTGLVREAEGIKDVQEKSWKSLQEEIKHIGIRSLNLSSHVRDQSSQIDETCGTKPSVAVVATQVTLAICLVLLVVAVVVLSILFKKVTEKYVSIDKKLGSFQATYPPPATGLAEGPGHVTPIHEEAPPTQQAPLPTEPPKADFVANMEGDLLGKGTGTTEGAPMEQAIGTG